MLKVSGLGKTTSLRVPNILWACMLVIAWFLIGTQAKAEDPVNTRAQTIGLDEAFSQALTAINAERKTNSSNEFTCTDRFASFRQSKNIEPYLDFFRKIDIRPNLVNQNQKRFVTIELTREQLASRGYPDFRRGDKLVLVFETTSAGSGDVISFTARLFGRDYP